MPEVSIYSAVLDVRFRDGQTAHPTVALSFEPITALKPGPPVPEGTPGPSPGTAGSGVDPVCVVEVSPAAVPLPGLNRYAIDGVPGSLTPEAVLKLAADNAPGFRLLPNPWRTGEAPEGGPR